MIDADLAEGRGSIGYERERRDLYFGFAGGTPEDEDFSSMEAETSKLPVANPEGAP